MISIAGFSPLKGNNYTGAHAKETTEKYITNKVTALTNTDKVLFWAADVNKKSLSRGYDQYLGMEQDIRFKNDQAVDTQLRLAMRNARWQTDYAFVSGRVNFR